MIIANRQTSSEYPPFIIAEMSGDHNQSLERASKIVKAIADAGVHAIKLQVYTPDTMRPLRDKNILRIITFQAKIFKSGL